jgi:hypothetical protein
MNQPAFINPSSEPLKASMELQAKLEDDIRKLIHLAVANTANRSHGGVEVDGQPGP